MRRRIVVAAIALICGALATSCAGPTPLQLDTGKTTVEFSFRDSSVPPQYHRSYVIKATNKEASITVDSYGDVLAQETTAMPADTWTKVLELAGTLPTRAEAISEPEPGCTGGTASKIVIRDGDQDRYSKSAENCGGRSDKPLTETVAPLEALFDMKQLLKTGN
ncbi:hypothetical protein [Arthrobacter sp. 31Y]|uniref:hypothetical protein n=1 Tax=Arthrobacter sp. 31Y TaxID=1115632 RepID=UPI0004651996|nr:hypothetical protein [Arthrobacter sp. 31Y]